MSEYNHDAEAQKKHDNRLIRESSGLEDLTSIFSDAIVTIEEAKELALKRYITEDLIKEGQIVTVYGNAGAGKTSLILHFATRWIEDFHKQVLYVNMDGDNPMTTPLQEVYGERFINIGKGSSSAVIPRLIAINSKTLSQTVLIFDTYKKFTSDVNNKGANVALFEQLRQLQSKGASIIMLAHTNKDKKSHSGTADIEQDGDAMLRVSGASDGDTLTVSIKQGGRTRWEVTPKTFSMTIDAYPNPQTCIESDLYIDLQQVENEQEDTPHILAIKEILEDLGFPNTRELQRTVEENTSLSVREVKRVLFAYIGRHWARNKQLDGREYKWALID